VAVVLNGRRLAEGTGSSRQRAEEHAAGRALDVVHRPPLTEEPAL
jgi:dsRNA-specific ribonuclease